MKLKSLSISLIGLIVSFIVIGCAHTPAGFAPSVSPLSSEEKEKMTVVKHTTGSQSYFSLFGFLPFGRPNYDKAIKDSLESVPEGKTLINARSWSSSTWIIFGTVYTLHMEGDVIK